MNRVLVVVAAIAALSSGASVAQPRGGSPPPGSYWQSCRNVSTVDRGPNATVTAECRDERGRWRQTSLRFAGCREIYNRDGELTCRDNYGPPPGQGYPGGRYPNGEYPNAAYPAGGYPGGGRPGGGYPGGHGALTLFSGPDFSGQPFTTTSEITNLPRQFNDRAMSLRIDGRGAWQICSDSDFRGRCQVFDRDVGDLRRFGLAGQVSSMRQVR
jgi:hypothetical protein